LREFEKKSQQKGKRQRIKKEKPSIRLFGKGTMLGFSEREDNPTTNLTHLNYHNFIIVSIVPLTCPE
jgi:hypothetical protein